MANKKIMGVASPNGSERTLMDVKTYRKMGEFIRICRRAMKRAHEESRRLGARNVYSINGILYYELPNGELSRTDPYDSSKGGSMNESQEPAG